MKMTRATNRYFMRGGLLLAGLPGGGVSQRGGGVSGERVAVTEAGDRDVEAASRPNEAAARARSTLNTPPMTATATAPSPKASSSPPASSRSGERGVGLVGQHLDVAPGCDAGPGPKVGVPDREADLVQPRRELDEFHPSTVTGGRPGRPGHLPSADYAPAGSTSSGRPCRERGSVVGASSVPAAGSPSFRSRFAASAIAWTVLIPYCSFGLPEVRIAIL
jgi:hypothetical protein